MCRRSAISCCVHPWRMRRSRRRLRKRIRFHGGSPPFPAKSGMRFAFFPYSITKSGVFYKAAKIFLRKGVDESCKKKYNDKAARESTEKTKNAGIAQSVEQLIRNQQVVCSSHISSSKVGRGKFPRLFCFKKRRIQKAAGKSQNLALARCFCSVLRFLRMDLLQRLIIERTPKPNWASRE